MEYGILKKDHPYYGVDEMVLIKCERGFKLRGASKLTCGEDGEFDKPIPTCEGKLTPFVVIEKLLVMKQDG